MATITLDIPDDQVPRISDAFAAHYGWSVESGVTALEFARVQVIAFINATVQTYEIRAAEEQARAAAISAAAPNIT